eukprot:TRINITY_DN33342_c0_g1_i2.p1 TRINITY_DN33342_c0_g1~~TRINITY_DN33342_c0_g1_i2.p1  ORF type:complete len:201 (+),score=44.32 TRINITY_DN33342_c0_g1_i2:65-604(+)
MLLAVHHVQSAAVPCVHLRSSKASFRLRQDMCWRMVCRHASEVTTHFSGSMAGGTIEVRGPRGAVAVLSPATGLHDVTATCTPGGAVDILFEPDMSRNATPSVQLTCNTQSLDASSHSGELQAVVTVVITAALLTGVVAACIAGRHWGGSSAPTDEESAPLHRASQSAPAYSAPPAPNP